MKTEIEKALINLGYTNSTDGECYTFRNFEFLNDKLIRITTRAGTAYKRIEYTIDININNKEIIDILTELCVYLLSQDVPDPDKIFNFEDVIKNIREIKLNKIIKI